MSGNWRDAAACAGEPRNFFGLDSESTAARRRREARAVSVCAGCPSKSPCLEFALELGLRYGVWGGLGEDDRIALAASQERPGLCRNGLHLMTGSNVKIVAGTTWKRCRACAQVSDRRTAKGRREQRTAA